ncbi:MAG: PIN domain-containing protein [Acidobacteriota bacterium]
MIFLDTSVALAQLLAEDRYPPASLWDKTIVASRVLEYELWNAIHRRALLGTHGTAVVQFVQSIAFAELTRETLRRATEPFPHGVRTLDALHLATILFLRDQGMDLSLASYDERMIDSATALEIPLAEC